MQAVIEYLRVDPRVTFVSRFTDKEKIIKTDRHTCPPQDPPVTKRRVEQHEAARSEFHRQVPDQKLSTVSKRVEIA